jgi:autotransporter-associated beta strand protein
MKAINRSTIQRTSRAGSQVPRSMRAAWMILAAAPVAWGLVCTASGQVTATWDSSGSGTPTDGPGNWDTTTSANWLIGSPPDAVWVNGNTALFGVASGAGDVVTIDDASSGVTAAGLTFNPPGSGNYTIAAMAGDSLALTGTASVPAPINVAAGLDSTISAPITGSNGLTLIGPGTLDLSGANTYDGNTALNSGTLNLDSGGTLGDPSAALVFGTVGATQATALTTVSTLNVNTSATVSSLTVATNTTANNTLAIGSGETLNVQGSVTLSPPSGTASMTTHSNLVFSGDGTLNVSSGTFSVATGANSTSNAGVVESALDMSGLANFTFSTSSGEFDVGFLNKAEGNVKLANTSNSITAAAVRVGDGFAVGTTTGLNATGTDTLALGAGTNVIDANTITVGMGKDTATIDFLTTTGSLTLANEAGTGAPEMTIGEGGTGSGSANGTVDLTGHDVNLTLDTLQIGYHPVSTSLAVGGAGSFSFDSGTVNVNDIIMAHASGSSTTAGSGAYTTATLTVGSPGDANTATLNVDVTGAIANGVMDIGNSSSTPNVAATAILNIDQGGIANINAVVQTNNAEGSATGTINLDGGTLNMMGKNIGATVGSPMLNITAGTLENVGHINSTDGVTMGSDGNTLTLAGTNGYTGPTTVNAGTVVVANAGALPADNAVAIAGGALQLAVNSGGESLSSLSITGGVMDIGNNHMIIDDPAGAIDSTVAGYLAAGYNGGNWNSASGVTTTAPTGTKYGLGYADGADGGIAGVISGQIEVMYTLYGDTNLDGTVNSIDFGNLAANFGKSGKIWDQGDFNYDGTVNSVDFGLLAGNFGKSLGSAGDAVTASDWAALDAFASENGLTAEVPEPASVGLILFAGVGALARRRRRSIG